MIKVFLSAFIAAIPLKKIAEAMRKDYAKAHAIDEESVEALIASSGKLLRSLLLLLLLTVPVYGWFVYSEGLSVGSLVAAKPLISALARFLPKLFVMVSIPVASCGLFWLLLRIIKDEHTAVIEGTKKLMFRGWNILKVLAAFAGLIAELYCIAEGNLSYMTGYFDGITWEAAAGYAIIVVLLTSLAYYLYVCGEVFVEGIPEIAGTISKKNKMRCEIRKMKRQLKKQERKEQKQKKKK